MSTLKDLNVDHYVSENWNKEISERYLGENDWSNQEQLTNLQDIAEGGAKPYDEWVDEFNSKMGNIYSRLNKLETYKQDEPIPPVLADEEQYQRTTIEEMYERSPHIRNVDNLLRRDNFEEEQYRPKPSPSASKSVQDLIEQSSRLLNEEFSDLALEKDTVREYNVTPRFGTDFSPQQQRTIHVGKKPYIMYSQSSATHTYSSPAKSTPKKTPQKYATYETESVEINKLFPHLLHEINELVGEEKEENTETRYDRNVTPVTEEYEQPQIEPNRRSVESFQETRKTPSRYVEAPPAQEQYEESASRSYSFDQGRTPFSTPQTKSQRLDHVSFQDIIRDIDATTEHIMTISPSTSRVPQKLELNYERWDQERRDIENSHRDVNLNFPNSLSERAGYIPTGTLSPSAQVIANNITNPKPDYYQSPSKPHQQYHQYQQQYQSQSYPQYVQSQQRRSEPEMYQEPPRDVYQTPPQRDVQHRSPRNSEKVPRRLESSPRRVPHSAPKPSVRSSSPRSSSPRYGSPRHSSPRVRRQMFNTPNNGIARYRGEDHYHENEPTESEIEQYEDDKAKRKVKKAKEKAPIPYSDVRHLNQNYEGNYNHSTIDWYLNLCGGKYQRTPSPERDRNVRVKWVGMQKNGRQQ